MPCAMRLPFFILAVVGGGFLIAQIPPDRCLVPASIRDPILNEFSGERAFLHVQILSGTRDRQAEEYQNQYFETSYIRDAAIQSGLSGVNVELFPTRNVWDAEEGDLWLVAPVRKKIASVNQVASSLASGSMNADVEAEVVYVGAGREADYAGKDVTGKIVLGSGSVSDAFNSGVNQRGAAGALGSGSVGVSGNAAGYSLDQIGWASISPRTDKGGFGFALSLRQFLELRGYIERGLKVVVRAHVRAKNYPSKMNVISAAIPGTDPAAGELLCVAHAYETISKPGANDNCTGVGTILEIGRTLSRLIKDGTLPAPRRTIRFLWGNEISGSTAFMNKHPELQDRLLAALNFDMTGANMKTTDSYLRVKMTPDGRPSYLNDLITSLLVFTDQAEIRTSQGVNAPFNYRLAPLATITSSSDHSVFLAAAIPAMQFNYWPDNFYHSSEDRIIHVDPTELKRVGFMAASAFYYLANAGVPEAKNLAWEAAANGDKWIAEVCRQSIRLLGSNPEKVHLGHAAAQTKVAGAFQRARGGVESVRSLTAAPEVESTIRVLAAGLESSRDLAAKRVESMYRDLCASLGVKPAAITISDKEREYSRMIPRRRFKVYGEEAQKQSPQGRGAGGPPASRTAKPGLPGFAETSINYFIDGRRSILEIYHAVRAECGHLQVGSTESKFAYVLGLEYPDVDLEAVANAIRNLERTGVVEIITTAAQPGIKK
jgi:aminopeptidase YwaD